MGSNAHCILGQVFGSYDLGMSTLGLTWKNCVYLGFQADPKCLDSCSTMENFDKLDTHYDLLTKVWIDTVRIVTPSLAASASLTCGARAA
jgi:hypothetical protein